MTSIKDNFLRLAGIMIIAVFILPMFSGCGGGGADASEKDTVNKNGEDHSKGSSKSGADETIKGTGNLIWAKRAGGYWDCGNGITTLSDNSTVVTGFFMGTATFGEGEPNQTILESAGDADIFIARFEP